MDELQLQDLKNIDAADPGYDNTLVNSQRDLPAVDVQKKASPAIHEVSTVVRPPASGRDIRRPMMDVGGKVLLALRAVADTR